MSPSEDRLRLSLANWVVGGSLIVNHPGSRVVSGVVTARKKSVENSSKDIAALTVANTEANKKIVVEEKRGCCKECNRDCNCKVSEIAKPLQDTEATETKLVGDNGKKIIIASDEASSGFTVEQDSLLRSLKAENKSWKEICSQLGMPKHALHHRYKELIRIDHQTAAANGTSGVALMSGANPAAGTKYNAKNPKKNIKAATDEKRDSEVEPFGGLFEEADWGPRLSGDQWEVQKSDHVSNNVDEWGECERKVTSGQIEDSPSVRAVQNRSSTNPAEYEKWYWGGDQNASNCNHDSGHNHKSQTRGDESGWGGYQPGNNDNEATSNAFENTDYTWGGDQIVNHDNNMNDNNGSSGGVNSGGWAWGGEQNTNSKIANSYSKIPAAGQSNNNSGKVWGWGRDQTTHKNAGSDGNWAWGADQDVKIRNVGTSATYQGTGPNFNQNDVHWGWSDGKLSIKNTNAVQGSNTLAFDQNPQNWEPAKRPEANQNAKYSDPNNTKLKVDNVTPPQYPQYPSHPQVYYPPPYPSVPFPLSYSPPFFHQVQPRQPSTRPIPLNPLTGRLQPDNVWSLRDCAILEFLMSRHASERWMTMQAEFFNWTGRMVHANIIKGKFQKDGVLAGGRGGGGDGAGEGGGGGESRNNLGGGGNWD